MMNLAQLVKQPSTQGHSKISSTAIVPIKSNQASAINTAAAAPISKALRLNGAELANATQASSLNKSERFAQFALLGQRQQQIANLQHSEQKQTQLYRELMVAEQALDKKSATPEHLAMLINRSTEKHNNVVSQNLHTIALSNQKKVSEFSLQGIDLLSAKPSETITILLPGARQSIAIALPAFGTAEQAIGAINQSFQETGITAKQGTNNQLIFSVTQSDEKKFSQPAQLSGEGIRVPAGNPVPVMFAKVSGKLAQLSQHLEQGNIDEARSLLSEGQTQLKQNIAQLRKAIQHLAPELKQALKDNDKASPNPLPDVVASELSQTFSQGNFGDRLTAIMAQANISRDNTVALLKP